MKQHITAKQINELSEKGKKKYKKWCLKKGYIGSDDILTFQAEWDSKVKIRISLLSIGQMIEFLGDEWANKFDKYAIDEGGCWLMKNEELCDALWEAVKEVLK